MVWRFRIDPGVWKYTEFQTSASKLYALYRGQIWSLSFPQVEVGNAIQCGG